MLKVEDKIIFIKKLNFSLYKYYYKFGNTYTSTEDLKILFKDDLLKVEESIPPENVKFFHEGDLLKVTKVTHFDNYLLKKITHIYASDLSTGEEYFFCYNEVLLTFFNVINNIESYK